MRYFLFPLLIHGAVLGTTFGATELTPAAPQASGSVLANTLPPLTELDRVPSTFCRYVPERVDDFAWENDRIAFRIYGPAIAGQNADSGVDCWLKYVEYPIINRWYAGMKKGLSYHDDHGEGCDPYHVGKSRGCGGTALWVEEKMVTAGPYLDWHIEEQSRERSAFTVTYRYPASAGEEPVLESKTITISLGDDWFTSTSTFTRNGKPLVGQTVAVGVTTHDGKGVGVLDPNNRWASVWEEIKQQNIGFLGTGIALPAGAQLKEIRAPKAPDTSHVLAILKTDSSGRIRIRAGFSLVKAGPGLFVLKS